MGSRQQLGIDLKEVLNATNVYFQPPPTIKMKYPAIVYNLSDLYQRHADNRNYINKKRYTVTYIHNDPDTDLKDAMFDKFEMVRFDRRFVNDNLYHDVYSIYY